MKDFFKTHSSLITIFGLIILSIIPIYVAFIYPHNYLSDDYLITLTFVKNIIKGNGWVFNYPPPVLATTTPLFTIVISLIAYVLPFLEITQIAVFFTSICLIAIIWIFFFAKRILRISNSFVIFISFLIIISMKTSILGMELYFFTLILILAIISYYKKSHFICGILTALLFLTRGEGVLLLIIFVIIQIVSYIKSSKEKDFINSQIKIKSIKNLVFGFFLPFLIWTVYSLYTFGNIFPNTLSAKLAQKQSGIWVSFTKLLFTEWLPNWSKQYNLFNIKWLSLWYPIITIGLITVIKKHKKWIIFLYWVILYIFGYSLLGVSGYTWYGFHIYFVLMLLYGFGIFSVSEFIYKMKKGFYSYLFLIIFLFISVYPIIRTNWDKMFSPRISSTSKVYYKMSKWIKNNIEPSKTIAYFEIGYLGYYTNNKIFDLVGLTNPKVLKYIANRNFSQGFWDACPDYLIYKKGSYFQPYVKYSKKFKSNYIQIHTFENKKTQFIIYKRKY